MRRISIIMLIGLILFIPTPSSATVTTITFEEPAPPLPPSVPPPSIGLRYSNYGVILPKKAQIVSMPHISTISPPNVLTRPWTEEFDPDPLIIEFTYLVQAVSLYTGVPWDSDGEIVYITLEAFDDKGNRVAKATEHRVGPTDIDVQMQVLAPNRQHIIKKIQLDARYGPGPGRGYFEYIDNLSLTSEGKPPVLATEPPQVVITSPTDPETKTGKITISGNIYGEGLLPEKVPPELIISYLAKPTLTNYHKEELKLGTDLHKVGAEHLQFSLNFQLTHFGENTITVMATNGAGTGWDQTSITYFSQAITDEYNKKGGWGTFGDFQWSETDDCAIYMYQSGAILSSPYGIYSVLGKIFNKWKPHSMLLGCAKGEEKTEDGVISQDFVGGRIYSYFKGTYYVLEPFRDAIDKLDFVTDYGLPVTETVKQEYQILLPVRWQRFERTIGNVSLISTMEVTENPLTLWIATPDIEGAERAGVVAVDIASRIPTVWRKFQCNKIGEPCLNVGKPSPTKKTSYSYLVTACNGGKFPFDAPQWASLEPNKIIPLMGNVKASGLSGEDFPYNHDCHPEAPDKLEWAELLLSEGVDWCIHVVPDPEFEHLLGEDAMAGYPTTLQEQDTVEIEYEWCLVGYPPPKDPNDPTQGAKDNLKPGDKLFVAGRWISDCGCHPFSIKPSEWHKNCTDRYKSEIHPPAVLIRMYSKGPATIAELCYFDWWYSGEVVEVDIYPPPRPKPSVLPTFFVPKLGKIPKWGNLCPSDSGLCGLNYSVEPKSAPNHIHLVLSGRPDIPFHTPPKENEKNGQLYHGHVPCPKGKRCPIDPYYPHNQSLVGNFELSWGP